MSKECLMSRGFKYLARDDDELLYAYIDKPEKLSAEGGWVMPEDSEQPYYFEVDDRSGAFDTIKWEDEEPTEIETLKSAVRQPLSNPIEFGGLSIHKREGGGMAIFKTEDADESNSRIYTTVTDSVNHPAHYKHGEIETLDIIRMSLTAEEFQGFLKGNVLKYQIRAPFKHETPDEDYAKAKYYYDEYREVTE